MDNIITGAEPIDKKKTILLVAGLIGLIIIAAALGSVYLLWKNAHINPDIQETPPGDAAKVILPSLSTSPLENKPNVNPAEKSNPITNIKINPFE